MRWVTGAAILLALAVGAASAEPQQSSQGDLQSSSSEGQVSLVGLSQPAYPVVARTARITGDVELRLTIRADGSVESATAKGGHPLLQQAALKSAQQSHFECRGCGQGLTSHTLTYSFRIVASPDFPCPAGSWLHVGQVGDHITVMTEPSLVHPYFTYTQARSAKCLYLWRCGRKWGGEGYYFERVPSLKCLDLWNCGYRLREPFATCKKLHRKLAY